MSYTSITVASALICLVSCTSSVPRFDDVYLQVTPKTIQTGSPLPPVVDKPMMTVTGKIQAVQLEKRAPTVTVPTEVETEVAPVTTSSQPEPSQPEPSQAQPLQTTTPQAHKGHRILMDRTHLNALGLVEYAVEDPFEQTTNTFRGVLFRDLLELWQVSPDAKMLTITALDDYQVQVPISILKEYPILLAHQQNGEMMTRDYRGPAMLVTPLTQYPSVKELSNQYQWIWQITKIHVE